MHISFLTSSSAGLGGFGLDSGTWNTAEFRRWDLDYDVYLNRFLSPDDIIPDPYNPLDWDRYSYSRNNPLRFNDPSGHSPCDVAGADPECPVNAPKKYQTFDERFGLTFTGSGWTATTKAAVRQAAFRAGMAFWKPGMTYSQAFSQEYSSGITFEWNTNDPRMRTAEQNANPACNGNFSGDCAAGGGFTASSKHILFASMSGQGAGQLDRMVKNVLHELGHAYRAGHGGIDPPQEYVNHRAEILRPNQYDGVLDWQQNMAATPSETFADMFIARVYGAWNTNPRNVTIVNQAQTWMNGQMP